MLSNRGRVDLTPTKMIMRKNMISKSKKKLIQTKMRVFMNTHPSIDEFKSSIGIHKLHGHYPIKTDSDLSKEEIKVVANRHPFKSQVQSTIGRHKFHCFHVIETGLDSPEETATVPDINFFRNITRENLSLKYGRLFSKEKADMLLQSLERQIEYFEGDLLKVKVYGKWHDIPRKQVCYGDPGLTYSFSGNCFPARPWDECDTIQYIKKLIEDVCQYRFNFVLVNRYKNGEDHMGEHRDDEKELVPHSPIASLSLGQERDFIFKHKDARGVKRTRSIPPVSLSLEHGSLLLMEWPTNEYWYHSLPVRAKARNVRINLTFRHMIKVKK